MQNNGGGKIQYSKESLEAIDRISIQLSKIISKELVKLLDAEGFEYSK